MNDDSLEVSVTNRCNLDCLACPQERHEQPQFHDENLHRLDSYLMQLDNQAGCSGHIVLTGGEPFAATDRLKGILQRIRLRKFRGTITILTNGSLPLSSELVNLLRLFRIRVEIPLYGVTARMHDSVTKVKCFYTVIENILNYSALGIPVILRVVILRLNFHELAYFPEFIVRNIPSISKLCLMGPEMRHMAAINFDNISYNPLEVADQLTAAHIEADRRDIDLMIFNIPMCFLNKSEWSVSRQSISLWKISFPLKCRACEMVNQCCGLFATAQKNLYQDVFPIKGGIDEFER